MQKIRGFLKCGRTVGDNDTSNGRIVGGDVSDLAIEREPIGRSHCNAVDRTKTNGNEVESRTASGNFARSSSTSKIRAWSMYSSRSRLCLAMAEIEPPVPITAILVRGPFMALAPRSTGRSEVAATDSVSDREHDPRAATTGHSFSQAFSAVIPGGGISSLFPPVCSWMIFSSLLEAIRSASPLL